MAGHERLDDFDVHPDGSVTLHSSDPEGYATRVDLSATEIAQVAEASAGAWRVRLVPCRRCHIDRQAAELNNCGICTACVTGR